MRAALLLLVRFAVAVAVAAIPLAGCERGCAWGWLRAHGFDGPATPSSPGSFPTNAVDCPDGLARCLEGAVSASRLATVTVPCRGPERACSCPWDAVGVCPRGCVVEGLEVSVERRLAATQLCAPETAAERPRAALPPPAPPSASPPPPPPPGARPPLADGGAGEGSAAVSVADEIVTCDEQQLFRCRAARLYDCVARVAVSSCLRGCIAEDATIDDEGFAVSREQAFAILCLR